MNITEKIIAAHCGREKVEPDELVTVTLDGVLANDVSGPIAIRKFREAGFEKVFDPERIYLVNDHFTPNCSTTAAMQSKTVRLFAEEQNISNFFDVGRMGIEHALLPEKGLVYPGEIVVGGDSHTCTYGALGAFSTGMGSTDIGVAIGDGKIWLKVPQAQKFIFDGLPGKYVMGKDLMLYTIGQIGVDGALYMTMEFSGEAISALSMDGRFSMCNMAIEAGGKNGVIEADEKTEAFVSEHGKQGRTMIRYQSDSNADYAETYRWNVSELEPVVACPGSPQNVCAVSDVKSTPVHQVVIGSCTNGRFEDLQAAAEILKGKKVSPRVRTIIIPATNQIYTRALEAGLIGIFLEAGAAVSTPTCGPCFGGHMGLLAADEVCVSTTNRNFIGRMGHVDSKLFLANPYVAAASAIAGEVVHPREVR